MKHLVKDGRARFKFDTFVWLHRALTNTHTHVPESVLVPLCQSIAHAIQLSWLSTENSFWKKRMIKILTAFIRKHVDQLSTKKLWSNFTVVTDLRNGKTKEHTALKNLGSFQSLCSLIESKGVNSQKNDNIRKNNNKTNKGTKRKREHDKKNNNNNKNKNAHQKKKKRKNPNVKLADFIEQRREELKAKKQGSGEQKKSDETTKDDSKSVKSKKRKLEETEQASNTDTSDSDKRKKKKSKKEEKNEG